MTQAFLTSNPRPPKIAYLIDDTDLDRFIDVALLCCTQWGGIRNFIIPVKAEGVDPLFLGLLRLHPPDIVIRACRQRAAVQDAFCGEHLRPSRTLASEDFRDEDPSVHALASYGEVGEGTQWRLNDPRPVLLEYEQDPDQDPFYRACTTAAFGAIYPGQRPLYEARLRLMSANRVVPGHPFVDHQLATEPLASVINLTATSLVRHHVEGSSGQLHFDVVLATTLWELCWYWTKRAVTEAMVRTGERRTLLIPAPLFDQPDVRQRLFDAARRALMDPYRVSSLDINFVLYEGKHGRPYRSIVESEEAGLIRRRAPGEEVTWQWRFSSMEELEPTGRYLSGEPLIYDVNLFVTARGTYREGMEYIPPKPLDLTVGRNRLPVPARPSLPHNAGLIALDVEGDLWEGLPVCSSLAQSIHPDGRFTHYGLTTLTYPSQYETEWELNLPTELQAVQMYFADGGCQATLGQAGSHAQILINLMGGVAACDRLRDPAVFHVLRTLTVRTVTKLAQNVTNLLQGRIASLSQAERDAVGDLIRTSFAEADVVPVLGRTPSTLRQLREDAELRQFYQQIPDILNDLIARRIVFRGCHVVCVQCATRSWFPLSAVDDFVVCPGCFHRQPLSVTVNDGERPWEYRLNAAVNAALDQDALAPILLLAKLVTADPAVHAPLVGVELRPSSGGDSVGDFDIVYVRKRSVYAGECKAGSRLGEKDISLARLARDVGCAGFHFAALNDFDAQSLTMIESLRQEIAGVHANFEVFVHGRHDLLATP